MPAIARILATRRDIEPHTIACAVALACLAPSKATAANISAITGLQGHEVARGLSALGKLGLVEVVGQSARPRRKKLVMLAIPMGWLGSPDILALGAFVRSARAPRSAEDVAARFGWPPRRIVRTIEAAIALGAVVLTANGRLRAAP